MELFSKGQIVKVVGNGHNINHNILVGTRAVVLATGTSGLSVKGQSNKSSSEIIQMVSKNDIRPVFNEKRLLNTERGVDCGNREVWDAMLKFAEEKGIKWRSGHDPMYHEDFFSEDRTILYFNQGDGLSFSHEKSHPDCLSYNDVVLFDEQEDEKDAEDAKRIDADFLEPFMRVRIASGDIMVVVVDADGDLAYTDGAEVWHVGQYSFDPEMGADWFIERVYAAPDDLSEMLDPSKHGDLLYSSGASRKEKIGLIKARNYLRERLAQVEAKLDSFDE